MNTANDLRRRRPQPVWRWMILFSFITLLMSLGLMRAVSPLGDSVVAFFNNGEQTFTGIITVQPDNAQYVLHDGDAVYVLSGRQVPKDFVSRKVRVRGTLRGHAPILDVKAIDPA
jgi:hypothetical protein